MGAFLVVVFFFVPSLRSKISSYKLPPGESVKHRQWARDFYFLLGVLLHHNPSLLKVVNYTKH